MQVLRTNYLFDAVYICMYNVITMKANVVKIGNSKGVRIPKQLLEEAQLTGPVDLRVTDGALVITPIKPRDDWAALSDNVLAEAWDTPEEDAAWAFLQ